MQNLITKQKEVKKAFRFIIMHIILLTSIVILSKYSFASAGIHPFFLLFLRYAFSFVILLPIIVPAFLKTYKIHRFKTSFRRSFINISALALWSYAYSHVSLGIATTLTFIVPVFTIVIAEIYLKERFLLIQKILVFVSLIGVFISIRPNLGEGSFYYFIIFIATILWAISNISRKVSSNVSDVKTWICYFSIWSLILTFFLAIPFYSPIPIRLIPVIAVLSILTSFANIMSFNAYKQSRASFVQSFDFLRLIFAGMADIFIFGQSFHFSLVIGSFLIIFSSACLLFIENKNLKLIGRDLN
jgi:S-adenosylmethionine uptake transporter